MTCLVTGANGFVGRALVRTLVARGQAVRALVRPGSEAAGLRADGAGVVHADALDATALGPAVRGCGSVFHLAGVRRGTRREEFIRGNAESTRLLLDACVRERAASQRFVLAGSLAACGPSRTPRREEEPFAPREWYGESKAEAERIAFAYRDALPVAVARPPRVMGPGDRENLLLFRIAARGLVLRILGPERPLSWIDVDDCASGLVTLSEHPRAVGEAFFLASPARTDVVGLQHEVARALGVRARELPVPPLALGAAAWGADVISNLTGRKLPLNRKLARQVLATGWTCDTSKARDRLGFEAPTALADSLARAARWYRDQRLL